MYTKTALSLLAFLGVAAATPVAYNTTGGATVANAPLIHKRQTYSGVATYYTQDGVAGSCGIYNSDSSYICAMSTYWTNNEYQSAVCGDQITITNTGGGQDNNGAGNSVTVTVADTCEACDETHLDLSEGAFEALTGGNLDPPGTFNIDWSFV